MDGPMVSQRLAQRVAAAARRGADSPGDLLRPPALLPAGPMRPLTDAERPQWVADRLRELPEPRGPRDREATWEDLYDFLHNWHATAASINLPRVLDSVARKGTTAEITALIDASGARWGVPDALLTNGEQLIVAARADDGQLTYSADNPRPTYTIDAEGLEMFYGPATAFFELPDALRQMGLDPATAPAGSVIPVNLPPPTLTPLELLKPARIMARWPAVMTYLYDSAAVEDRHAGAVQAAQAVADRTVGTVTERKAVEAREAALRPWRDLYATRYGECIAALRPIYNLFQDIAAGLADSRATVRKVPSWV